MAAMLRAGINLSIGTDGPASNNDLDLFHEAQMAALLQKGLTGDPTVLPAEKVFSMLTTDGARALGLQETNRVARGWQVSGYGSDGFQFCQLDPLL